MPSLGKRVSRLVGSIIHGAFAAGNAPRLENEPPRRTLRQNQAVSYCEDAKCLAGSKITVYWFYVHGSVHRQTILINVQRDATQSSLFIILQVNSTCFGCQPHPSSGVHKTVTTVSGTGHIFCASYLPPTRPSLVALEGGSCTVSEAVVTVLCIPDDGCGWHPKNIEWTFRIINRLLFVASRWTIINIV